MPFAEDAHSLSLFAYCPRCGATPFLAHNVKSKYCPKCGFVYYLNPSTATAAFIEREDGAILVGKRLFEPMKDTFDLPGGFVDFNETAEEAIIREVYEETQIRLTSPRYLFSLPNEYEYSGFVVPTEDLFFHFVVKASDLQTLASSDDIGALQWVMPVDLASLPFGLTSIRKAVSIFVERRALRG